GLRVDGRLVAPRARIRAAFVVPDQGATLVRIERRRAPDLHLVVRNPAEGRAVLRSLGLDASQVAASFRLRPLAQADGRRFIGYLALIGLFVGFPVCVELFHAVILALALAAGCVIALVVWMIMISVPARVVVGTDGVLVSWFFEERFIPYAEIRHVT